MAKAHSRCHFMPFKIIRSFRSCEHLAPLKGENHVQRFTSSPYLDRGPSFPAGIMKHTISILCQGALQFALDLRRTRALYRIIVTKGELVGEWPKSIMQEISVGRQLAPEHSPIAFALSGQLVRDPITISHSESQFEVLGKGASAWKTARSIQRRIRVQRLMRKRMP
jgi:hypothetical protein